MTDSLKSRRLKTKLGMTVQKPTDPFHPDAPLTKRMLAGLSEQEKLELQGRAKVKPYSARSQKRIPKASPAYQGKTRRGRA